MSADDLAPVRLVFDSSEAFAPEKDDTGRPPGGGGGPPRGGGVEPPAHPDVPEFSDEALTLNFTDKHRDDLRYVDVWKRWLVYDGTCWKEDSTLNTFDLARVVCRETSEICKLPGVATRLASAKTVAAVHSLARSDRRFASTVDQWDHDPWMFNTQGGAVGLRNGGIRPQRRDDYFTKITPVAPGDVGDCPQWREFLKRVTGGDDDLVLYIQRAFGYALTGVTREHCLFFVHGTGANGKSVLLGIFTYLLGGYATTAPIETFVASHGERHPTELASLRGARLVTAIETEEGRSWAESKLKMMTGGDRISARFMRQDFFEFTPQFKLWIVGNHRPALRSVDEAIRRRMRLIPFSQTIPVEERDDTLVEKLKEEGPAILAWMIEGASDWGMMGLREPEAVRVATTDYLDAEDAIGQWIKECCEIGSSEYATTASLFSSWKPWAERSGEPSLSMKRFSQRLASKGFLAKRQAGTGRSGFTGIGFGISGSF